MGAEHDQVWIPLRKALARKRWHAQRIEDRFAVGIPDVNIHVPCAGDLWVELKYVAAITPAVNLGLRREQFIWMTTAHRAGRRCCLLVRVGKEGWFLWQDPKSWEKAKRAICWQELLPFATRLAGPGQVLEYFASTIR